MITLIKYLIMHCAPTLAHLKVANLFNYPFDSIDELRKGVSQLNDVLHPLKLSADVLKIGKKRALIYVYDEAKLKEVLNQTQVSSF